MTPSVDHKFIPLWNKSIPQSQGDGPTHVPTYTMHLPDPELATGCGVLIAPGGGYRILASDHEGLQVARAFNRIGVAAFVLRYRVGPTYWSGVSLLDGQRAVRHIRSNAQEYGILRLGMLGFSAGGHLTSAVGTSAGVQENKNDAIDHESSIPDFLVLIYAVTNGILRGRKANEYTPTDIAVSATTPPTFLVHTHEDAIVPSHQSLIFYEALRRNAVPAEMHVFGSGEHGVGLATGDPDVRIWFSLLHNWMRRNAFLTSKSRVSVRGGITIDGEKPGTVWLSLIPHNQTHPPARVKFDASHGEGFSIDSTRGPVPGTHRATVHCISRKSPMDASGEYTLSDEIVYETEVRVAPDEELVLNLSQKHRVSSPN